MAQPPTPPPITTTWARDFTRRRYTVAIITPVSVQHQPAADSVLASRQRYVARGVATPRLDVARAEGVWIEDTGGRRYLDFAGGIACQNLGHGYPAVVVAIHEQVD